MPKRNLLRGLALLLASIAGPLAMAADLDTEIGEATDAGIDFLLKEIEKQQVASGGFDGYNNGKIALETYALIVAGVSVEHPLIQKNFDHLEKMSLGDGAQTYSTACYAFALDAAISQLQADAALASPSQRLRDDSSIGGQYRSRLEACINALILIKRPHEGDWLYTRSNAGFDNSNTQFAVLGLGVGAKRRIPIPRDVWEEIAVHFLTGQKKEGPEVALRPEYYPDDEKGEGKRDRINIVDRKTGEKVEKKKPGSDKKEKDKEKRDGSPTVSKPQDAPPPPGAPEGLRYFARGWDYNNTAEASWNMTCGGTSSMILVEENLRGQVAPDFMNRIHQSIRDGYAWLMTNWSPATGGEWGFYGLYSLEKVADLGEVKKFGTHDWFQEVAWQIVNDQRVDGSWPGGSLETSRWNTSFALLILNRATSLLTQGRSFKQRLVLTGAIRRDKDISPDYNWVFVPEYDREFHIPSLLRQMKLRPSPRLLKIVELALRSYPEDQRGLLVWTIVRTRDAQKHKAVKAFLDDQLLQITGVKYPSSDKYEIWSKRWQAVQKIGSDAQDPEGLLAVYYPKTSQSLPLRKKVIWAVGRCKNPDLAALLIEDLVHPDPDVRSLAYSTLSLFRLSKEPMPSYDPKAEAPERERQAALVMEWYKKRTK